METVCGADFHWKVQILIFTSDTKILTTVIWISVGSPLTCLLELLKTFQVFVVSKFFYSSCCSCALIRRGFPWVHHSHCSCLPEPSFHCELLSTTGAGGALLSSRFLGMVTFSWFLQLCPLEVKQSNAGFCTLSRAWNWPLHWHVSGKAKPNICPQELEKCESIGQEINAIEKFWAMDVETHHPWKKAERL